jgi:hypothetical protein
MLVGVLTTFLADGKCWSLSGRNVSIAPCGSFSFRIRVEKVQIFSSMAGFPETDQIYTITARHAPELRLEVACGGSSNGTRLLLQRKSNAEAQRFRVSIVDSVWFRFEPLCALGQAIDNGGSHHCPCHLWKAAEGGDNALFTLLATPDGWFHVVAKSQGGHCWDIEGAGKEGAQLATWDNDLPQHHRQFRFERVEVSALHPTSGFYRIVPRHAPELRVEVAGGQKPNGTRLVLQRKSSEAAQKFFVFPNGVWFRFEPLCAPGQAIDNGGSHHCPCHLWKAAEGGDNALFTLLATPDGWFHVVAKSQGGHCWDIEGAGKEGAQLATWNSDFPQHHRQFRFEPCEAKVGPFLLLRHLGSGYWGDTWEAKHCLENKVYAVKLSRHGFSVNEATIAKEVKLLSELALHINCVRYHTAFVIDDQLLIQTELIVGKSGLRLWELPPLTPSVYVALAIQLFRGVGHLHSCGIIHRDLHPANVMIQDVDSVLAAVDGKAIRQDALKIIDLGNGLFLGDINRKVQWGDIGGWRAYFSPERIATGSSTGADDVYAAMTVLLSLLLGKSPEWMFNEYDDLSKRKAILEDKAFPVVQRRCEALLPTMRGVLLSSFNQPIVLPTATEIAAELERRLM